MTSVSTDANHWPEIYRSTFGFIYRDGDAYAAYHAALYARHPDRRVILAITVADDWSENANPADRISVALRVRPADGGLAMTVVNRNESPWAATSTHAGLLDRAAALEISEIEDVFHVADHIVEQDPTIKAHLASS
jgi:hypothetical protein